MNQSRHRHVISPGLALLVFPMVLTPARAEFSLNNAVIVISDSPTSPAEKIAPIVLVEEIEKRSGVRLPVQREWPTEKPRIILATRQGQVRWRDHLPRRDGVNGPETRAEGFSIVCASDGHDQTPSVYVIGADGRGVLFGVGRLLRALCCKQGDVRLARALDVATAPEYPIRGHQLGYRPRANSYDAWTPEQYEQYIRELALFGANAIENIPFEDTSKSVLMPVPREEMNRRISEICARYDLDYWVWTPADFPLTDAKRRAAELQQHESFYRACPRLDAVFFPGGDPGDNPPELVIPFLKDVASLLHKYHPQAKTWVSLQGFNRTKTSAFMKFVASEKPEWLGGLVAGPGSPPMNETRRLLPAPYQLRWYPDITHTVRCQYPVAWWDPAYALTLGREPVNPRPSDDCAIFRRSAGCTNGFLSYSDGMHDDVNKFVWSMLAWDPRTDVREMLVQYSRVFFESDVAEQGADAILGLENNWRGSLALNAGVDGVLGLWQRLEEEHAELLKSWRFRMHLMRAYYDAYTRHRLIYETRLEQEALVELVPMKGSNADQALQRALEVLREEKSHPCRSEWRARIAELADDLFKTMGYQTSVNRYHASGAERGCLMDFLDYPLNNRWWLEDEFARISKMPSEADKRARLDVIRTWENPGPGSFYDEVGHVGKSPHVIRGECNNTDPDGEHHENPEHSWWDDGLSRQRLSWQHHLDLPAGLAYEGLDPHAHYILRITGQGDCRPRAGDLALTPTVSSKRIGEFKEFPVPSEAFAKGRLRVTFDKPNESNVNWRRRSHIAEVWLLKLSQ